MKLLKKVNVIEVKRAFIVSQLVRLARGKRRYLGLLSKSDFKKKLKAAKTKVFKLKEEKLDKIIANEWKKRLKAYNSSEWYLGEVSTNKIGVWKRAGGLPLSWTNGSLKATAQKVKHAFDTSPKLVKKRARHSIYNILETNVVELQKEKYLFPIIFKSGTGTKGRKGLRTSMRGDIDDGCMRAVALTIFGFKRIKAYIGYPKNIKNNLASSK